VVAVGNGELGSLQSKKNDINKQLNCPPNICAVSIYSGGETHTTTLTDLWELKIKELLFCEKYAYFPKNISLCPLS